MILEKQRESQVYTEGESQESIVMTLDMESAQVLMQMLSKNLYSDAIGSTIREVTSNALDSHRRAGVDKPIIVSFKPNKDSNYEFSVEDFGIGLDDEDIRSIISKYGKSLAREEEYALGLMGLGFKAPLAYTSSFIFITRKNGMERKYMMYEGEEDNTIDLLHEKHTSESDGVKVIIPVKYGDQREFVNKIKEQLAYFESVYFDVPSERNYSEIANNFIIHRSEDYQYSELTQDSHLHICLDNVYYPIDWQKLGIPEIDLPIGLRFSLRDGIFPVPSRESIRYTQEAKKTIMEKIQKVADCLVIRYNASIVNTTDIQGIFNYYDRSERYIYITGAPAEKKCDILGISKHATVKFIAPKLEGVNLLDLQKLSENEDCILGEYKIRYTFERGKIKEVKGSYSGYKELLCIRDMDAKHYYIYDEAISGNKKEYLKSTFSYGEKYQFIRKTKSYKLGKWHYNNDSCYRTILNLTKYPKDQWRAMIKEFQYVQSLFINQFHDIDKIAISQEWIDDRKRERFAITGNNVRRVKLKGEVVGKLGVQLEVRLDGRHCKFVPETFKLENVHKNPYLTVYANHTENDKLEILYHITNKTDIKVVTFSDRELRVLEKVNIHNLISYTKFMEGDNKPFKRLITAYLINKLIKEQSNVFIRKNSLESISHTLTTKLQKLENYRDNHFNNASSDIYEAMLIIAQEHNLFDMEIYHVYTEIKSLLERLPFVESVMRNMGSEYNYNQTSKNSKELIAVLRDMFKYYRYRIDYTNYKITLNLPEEEVLTDDSVEKLENEV